MKRAQVLGSTERLSVTHLLILVLFLGSYTDVVKGASLAPTSSLSTSGTPSMSMSLTASVSQTTSGSSSGSLSVTGSVSVTGSLSISGTISGTISAAVTNSVSQLFSFTASLSFGASPSTSGSVSPTFGTSTSGTLSAALSVNNVPPPIFYGSQAFPAGTPYSVIQDFFCGNGYEDIVLGEQCDYGLNDVPRLSCCTKKCQYAIGGKICRPRGGTCFKKGRCGAKGFCRGTRPKKSGKGCTLGGVRGKCDGQGTCVPLTRRAVSGRALRFLRTGGGKHIKKLLKKRNLKIRKKHQNFNLDEIETETKSNKNKLKNNQNVVDEIFDEDEVSDADLEDNDEEDEEDSDLDQDEEQEDLDEQDEDQDNGLALFPEEN